MTEDRKIKIHKSTDEALNKGYVLWEKNLNAPVPEELRYFAADIIAEHYDGKYVTELASSAQSFFWFRYLHDIHNEDDTDDVGKRTLLGDWFFSCFSLNLIPIDSTEILNRFSKFLKSNINSKLDLEICGNFFKELPGALSDNKLAEK